MADKSIHLRVITPNRIVFDGQVESVVLPAQDGYHGVLPNHAPLIGLIGAGILSAKGAGAGEDMFVWNGFYQIRDNELRMICDAGEKVEEIDLDRAQEAEKRARERLEKSIRDDVDRTRAYMALQKSIIRQKLAERKFHRRKDAGLR